MSCGLKIVENTNERGAVILRLSDKVRYVDSGGIPLVNCNHRTPKTRDSRRTSTELIHKMSVWKKLARYSGERKYAAPCRNNPADAIGCENTIRIGTKIAPAPGVYGTATSSRVPSA